MSPEDTALIKRWVNERDPEAFKRLTQRYAQMVYATCRRILGNEAQAEEVAQDCFVHLIRAGSKPGPYLGPWLHRVATNLSLKRVRSESRRAKREQAYQEHSAATGRSDQAVLALVDEAIASLPEEQRSSVVAYYLEDQTHEQIAQRMGITRQGAAYRVQRGVESVREALHRKGHKIGAGAFGAAFAGTKAWPLPTSLSANLGRLALGGAERAKTIGAFAKLSGASKITTGVALLVAVFAIVATNRNPAPDAPAASISARDTTDGESPRAPDAGTARIADPSSEANITTVEPPEGATPERAEVISANVTDSANEELSRDEFSIEVHVVDNRGFPILGARVTILPRQSADNLFGVPNPPVILTTDREGIAQFEAIQGTELYISASARGYVTGSKRQRLGMHASGTSGLVLDTGEELTVQLELHGGVTLLGRVRMDSGEPAANAVVQPLGYASSRGHGSGGEDIYDIAVTDEDGRFELGYEIEGMAAIKITAANRTAKVFMNVPVGTETSLDFVLDSPASLSGVITNPDGSPAAHTDIALNGRFLMDRLDDDGNATPINGESDYLRTRTDANGRYVFESLAVNASYLFQVRSTEGIPLSGEIDLGVFAAGQSTTYDHVLEPMIRVFGTVTGEQTGKPINNVRIAYVKEGELHEGPYISQGNMYEMRLFETGQYYIYPEYNSWDRELTVDTYGVEASLIPGEERRIDFKLPDQSVRTILVVNPDGEPILSAQCDWVRYTHGSGHYGGGTTDLTGRHSHAFVPGFESWFYVSAHGFTGAHSQHITPEPGEEFEEETVVLYPSGGIEGTLVDHGGAPVANAEVKAALRAPGVRVSHNQFYEIDTVETTTDNAGRFAFGSGFPAVEGEFVIDLHLDDNEWYTAATVDSVSCVAGSVLDIGTVTIAAPR